MSYYRVKRRVEGDDIANELVDKIESQIESGETAEAMRENITAANALAKTRSSSSGVLEHVVDRATQFLILGKTPQPWPISEHESATQES